MTELTPSPKRLTGKILIVDDNEFDVYLLQKQIQEFDVTWAKTADEALILFAAGFDALVIDYLMPGLDGCELSELIREENNTIPILLVSGVMHENLKCQAKNLNVIASNKDYVAVAEIIRRTINVNNGRESSPT